MSQQINLFSPIFLKQKKYFSALAMLQGLGLIVLGSAVFYGYALYQVSALGGQAVETHKRLLAEQARLANFTGEFSPRQKSKLLDEEVTTLELRLKARQEVVDRLTSGAFGNTEGYSEYLRAFARQSVSGLWLTGFSIIGAGYEMAIDGRVLRPELVPSYIRRLEREPIMQGKQFAALQMSLPKGEPAKDMPEARYLEFTLRSSEGEAGK